MTNPVIFPGMIIGYGGDVLNQTEIEQLEQLGWLACDGAAYDKSKYPSLALSIGTSYGGTGGSRGVFNVPDLRGRFLRGTAYDSGKDPDADSRVAMNPGGAGGPALGSLQYSATALPKNPFVFFNAGDHSHTIDNVPQGGNAYALAGSYYAIRNTGGVSTDSQGVHSHQLANWDTESRPANLYINFLINTGAGVTPGNPNAIPLYGLISAFGFSLQGQSSPAAPWEFCNGGPLSQETFPLLFKALGTTWGPGDATTFVVPNLQGLFVQGADPSANPLATAQSFATGLPKNTAFQTASAGAHQHNVSNVPSSDTSYYSIITDHYGWNQQTQTTSTNGNHQHTCGVGAGSGGDAETRPVNAYVDFGVLGDTGESTFVDTYPIGAILSFGAPLNQQTLQSANWLYCDGSSVSRTQYAQLFTVIGTNFGNGDGVSTFNLPKFAGLFARGANGLVKGPHHDRDAKHRAGASGISGGAIGNAVGSYQQPATGAPANPMLTSQDGAHTHNVPNVPVDNSSSWVGGGGQSAWNSSTTLTTMNGAHTHAIASGGDPETRPVNVSCYYAIKFQ